MTPARELAERIASLYTNPIWEQTIAEIESLLEGAFKEIPSCGEVEAALNKVAKEARAAAFEEAAKIAEEISERELEVSRDYKGHMVFQSQSYIDACSEIAEQIRWRGQ